MTVPPLARQVKSVLHFGQVLHFQYTQLVQHYNSSLSGFDSLKLHMTYETPPPINYDGPSFGEKSEIRSDYKL